MTFVHLLAVTGLLVLPAIVCAHDDAHAPKAAGGNPAVQTPFGIAGDAAKATRTVDIDMRDTMRFDPSAIEVKRGETVRIVLHNRGATMHELVLGTPASLKQHATTMREHPEMAHEAPSMAHVAPGATGEIVWSFNRAGTFSYACLLPGHYEAGMTGRVIVR
jgi:uncharacterized cupredoxin-like copper-binding protein